MSKRTTESMGKSSPEWDELEDWLRGACRILSSRCSKRR